MSIAERSVCELIVRNLQLLQFNAHEIYETLHGRHLFTGSKPLYIAVGIYPTGALFNHECYPAVARCAYYKFEFFFGYSVSGFLQYVADLRFEYAYVALWQLGHSQSPNIFVSLDAFHPSAQYVQTT